MNVEKELIGVKTITKILDRLSNISLVFGGLITIFKFQQARLFYSVGIQGLFDYNVLAMLVNIAFNIFLMITVFYSLRALSLILKNQEKDC